MCGSVGVHKGAHWVYMGVHFALWVYTLLHAPKETLKHSPIYGRINTKKWHVVRHMEEPERNHREEEHQGTHKGKGWSLCQAIQGLRTAGR